MLSCPLHSSRHVNFCSDFAYCVRSQVVFTPPKRGENVSARSFACSAVRQRALVDGGICVPLFRTADVIFHRPGWIPSAAIAVARPAKTTTTTTHTAFMNRTREAAFIGTPTGLIL